jgi:hypothetical protein
MQSKQAPRSPALRDRRGNAAQRHTSSLKSSFVRRTIARGRAILRHAPNNTDARYLPDTNIKQRRETVNDGTRGAGEGRRGEARGESIELQNAHAQAIVFPMMRD